MGEKMGTGHSGVDVVGLQPMTEKEAVELLHLDESDARRFIAANLYRLPNLKDMTPAAARILGAHSFDLLELGMEKIEPEVFRAFIEANVGSDQESLLLELKLKEIGGADIAELLSNFHGDGISLCNISKLSVEEAQLLVNYGEDISKKRKVSLYLGIKEPKLIPPDALEALMNFRGELFIYFTSLTPETARILKTKKGGNVILRYLSKLDKSTADELGLKLYDHNYDVASGVCYRSGPIVMDNTDKLDRLLDKMQESISRNIEALPEEAQAQIPDWLPFFKKSPNFKDSVYKGGEKLREQLRQQGIDHPECFYNLNALHDVRGLVTEFLGWLDKLPAHINKDQFMERFKQVSDKDFSADDEFVEIYKDEIIQVMADHLQYILDHLPRKESGDTEQRLAMLQAKLTDDLRGRARKQLEQNIAALKNKLEEKNHKKNTKFEIFEQAKIFLEQFRGFEYMAPGRSSFKLASRLMAELTLGDKCSDCTSATISGMNFWTMPTWLADPGDNFLLQYDEAGNLAHKFLVVWEIKKDGTVILTLDSMELGNSQKRDAGMYQEPADKEKEKKMVKEAIDFIFKWAGEIGLNTNNIYATLISNTGTAEFGNFPQERVTLSKLNGLSDAAKVIKIVDPNFKITPRVYLQSYKSFENKNTDGETVDNSIFRTVEQKFSVFLNSEPTNDNEVSDFRKIRSILEEARNNAREAARHMRIFLTMEATLETKNRLSVDGERMDRYLHKNNIDFEHYFASMLSETQRLSGKDFVTVELYHLTPRQN